MMNTRSTIKLGVKVEAIEYENIFRQEETHFYYRSIHHLVLSLLGKHLGNSKKKLLDAGCGTGLLAKKLKSFGSVEALDVSPIACDLARKREVSVTMSSISKMPFPNETFDAVVSIDVLYHQKIRNDEEAILEIARVLKPGGLFILRVPAVSWLRSEHDMHVHTRERYGKKTLAKKLEQSFTIEKLTFIGLTLFPIALMRHLLFRRNATATKSSVEPLPKLLNRSLELILNLENQVALRTKIPVGIGLVAVGKKK